MAKQRVRVNTQTDTVYTPGPTVRYEGRLAYACQQAMDGEAPTGEALEVFMEIRVPIAASWPKKKQELARAGILRPARKPDADNYSKLLDALNFIAWNDDGQIVDLHISKFYSVVPGITIAIYIV